MIKAVFFDMNETLLSFELLKENFKKSFDEKYVLEYWFTKLLQTSSVMAGLGEYKNFALLAETTLESVFNEAGKVLTDEARANILNSFKNLAAYDDVPAALNILKSNAIRAIAVSNSSLDMMKQQLTSAGIMQMFDAYYSVDAVQKYKPISDIYEYVVKEEYLPVEDIVMVATHDWDLFGAKKVGLKTGYVKRKDVIFNPYYSQPDFCESNLIDLVNQFIK